MSFVWMDGCTTLLDMPARGGSHESRGEPVLRGLRPPKDNKSDSKENAYKE